MSNFEWSRRQFLGGQEPVDDGSTYDTPVVSPDLGLPKEDLLGCAYRALEHDQVALVTSTDSHGAAKSLLTQFGLRWGQILDVIDGADTRKVIATVISVEVRPDAHLPLVVPVEGAGEVGTNFRDLVTQKTQELYGLTVEGRFAQIDKERKDQAAQVQETRAMHRRVWLAGGSIFFAALAFVGAGPVVERWLKSEDEDPVTALNRHISERGPRQVATVLGVDRSIEKNPDQARTFLSELSPGHYDAIATYAASAEISEPDAVLLVKVLNRLAQLELSLGRASEQEADARAAFERRFKLILHDSPYREVGSEVLDLLKRL